MGVLKSWLAGRPPRAFALVLLALAATLTVVVGLEAGLVGGHGVVTAAASPDAPPSLTAAASSSGGPLATPTPSDTPTPTASPTPTPAPTAPPLPALLGAIGDSYSQAYSVSPAYLRDHTQFSWVIGTAKNDGVFSLAERFVALGSSPKLVDAATSGRKMNDAPRQAAAVVAATGKLSPGQTAYVTFELGTNDLCDDPKTDPASFESDLHSAISILRAGLPAGSRILMLSVPNFSHLRDITQADPKAKAFLALPRNSTACAPFLGDNSPSTLAEAETYLRQYDASLTQACEDISAAGAAGGKLYCMANESLLSTGDFTVADLSTVDYLHPSLSGQNRLADAAWAADVWGSLPMPPGAAAVVPAGGDIAAAPSITGSAMAFGLIGFRTAGRRRSRRRASERPDPPLP
jgi:lysophospholipase L1-like esterase